VVNLNIDAVTRVAETIQEIRICMGGKDGKVGLKLRKFMPAKMLFQSNEHLKKGGKRKRGGKRLKKIGSSILSKSNIKITDSD